MPDLACPHCGQTTHISDHQIEAPCPGCGQMVTMPATHITASPITSPAIRSDTPAEWMPRAAGAVELPATYASWDEFRTLSPVLQQELIRLATRALPDLRPCPVLLVPGDAPRETDDWRRPVGSLRLPGESRLVNLIGAWLLISAGLATTVFGAFFLLGHDRRPNPNQKRAVAATILVSIGSGSVVLGWWLGHVRRARLADILWVFEKGILVQRGREFKAACWDEVQEFEVDVRAHRRRFFFTLSRGFSLSILVEHAPEAIPLMEYVEVRMSACQLVSRLRSITHGQRERFGVVTLDRCGLEGPRFATRWSEVRRVIVDRDRLFVDSSRFREWVPVRYQDVSFPSLVVAISHILIEEHGRLPPVERAAKINEESSPPGSPS